MTGWLLDDIWGDLMFRRIGTKLYAALGLAVLLTLLSSGVGVYYFEVSGDLNHGLSREVSPLLRMLGGHLVRLPELWPLAIVSLTGDVCCCS